MSRRLRTSGLLAAFALAAAAMLAVVGAAPAGTAAPAANSVTFQDSTGENPAAPDITTVVASNNDAGIISFRINVPNRPSLTSDMLIVMWVDSDANPQTGDPDSLGAEYLVLLGQGEVSMHRWNGTDFDPQPAPAPSLIFAYQGGATISVSAAELGNTRRLSFGARVISGITFDPVSGEPDFTNTVRDDAPAGSAFYTFEVRIARPTLVQRRFTTTPRAPVAGRPFALQLQVARSDTGALLQSGRVTCVGRVGSARLRGTGRFVGRQAVCSFRIPANARGRTFRGSITVVFEGLRSTRSFSGRVG